jgi:hypothetical protein
VIPNSTSIQDPSKERLSAWRMQMAKRYHIRTMGAPRN